MSAVNFFPTDNTNNRVCFHCKGSISDANFKTYQYSDEEIHVHKRCNSVAKKAIGDLACQMNKGKALEGKVSPCACGTKTMIALLLGIGLIYFIIQSITPTEEPFIYS